MWYQRQHDLYKDNTKPYYILKPQAQQKLKPYTTCLSSFHMKSNASKRGVEDVL